MLINFTIQDASQGKSQISVGFEEGAFFLCLTGEDGNFAACNELTAFDLVQLNDSIETLLGITHSKEDEDESGQELPYEELLDALADIEEMKAMDNLESGLDPVPAKSSRERMKTLAEAIADGSLVTQDNSRQ